MYWHRRPDGRVYVYEYSSTAKKPKALPRAQIRHLDGQPDDVIQIYISSLNTAPRHYPVYDENLTQLIDKFVEFLKERGLDHASLLYSYRSPLLRYVVPFYLNQTPPLKQPDQWAGLSSKLLEHLKTTGCSNPMVLKVNMAFRGFWKWLLDEGLVPEGRVLRLRSPRKPSQSTVLQFSLKPDTVLNFVRECKEPDICLMALVGYFFSLRPQETFALTKTSFRAGSSASELECCKVLRKAGLYDKFAVSIVNQKSKIKKELKAPKSHSKGYVACFDEEAAREIIKLVRVASESMLFTLSVDYYSRRWARFGIKDITLKDLRRASLYHLGHYTELGIVELRSHARHAKITTTDLYLRRPAEDLTGFVELDLDA